MILENKYNVTPTTVPGKYVFTNPDGSITRDEAINLAAWLILTTHGANEVIELFTAIRNAGKAC